MENKTGVISETKVIEDDVYLTKDNKIVILHDGTLSRTTNGTGFIEDYTLEELKKAKEELL